RKNQAFHIKPRLETDRFSVDLVEVPIANPDYVGLLGDHVESIREKIQSARQQKVGVRIPKRVVEDLITTQEFQSIGGNLQLGIVVGGEFQLFTWVHPVVQG